MRKVILCERCDKYFTVRSRIDALSPFASNALFNHNEFTYDSSETTTSDIKLFTAGKVPMSDGYILPTKLQYPCMYVNGATGNIDFVYSPDSHEAGDSRRVKPLGSCHATHCIRRGKQVFYRVSSPLYELYDKVYHQGYPGTQFMCAVKDVVAGHHSTDWSTVKMVYYGVLYDEFYFTKEEQDKCLTFLVPCDYLYDGDTDLVADNLVAIQTTNCDMNSSTTLCELNDGFIKLTATRSTHFNGVQCVMFKCDEVLTDSRNFKCVVRTDTMGVLPSFVLFDHYRDSLRTLGDNSNLHEVYSRSLDAVDESNVRFFMKVEEVDSYVSKGMYVWTDALVGDTWYSTARKIEGYEGTYIHDTECEEALTYSYPDERVGVMYTQADYAASVDVMVEGVCESEIEYTASDGTEGNEWLILYWVQHGTYMFIKKPDFEIAYKKKQ